MKFYNFEARPDEVAEIINNLANDMCKQWCIHREKCLNSPGPMECWRQYTIFQILEQGSKNET